MEYTKIAGKTVSREEVCHIRGYVITKHVTSKLPEATWLDEPVYRVSHGATLMTSHDFSDLDTAIEYALGFVINETWSDIQDKFKSDWKEAYAKRLTITDEGVVSYGEGIA